jgi:hypothetical protein
VSHANAALTPHARLKFARLVTDQGWPVARAAERYDESWLTVRRFKKFYASKLARRTAYPTVSRSRRPVSDRSLLRARRTSFPRSPRAPVGAG